MSRYSLLVSSTCANQNTYKTTSVTRPRPKQRHQPQRLHKNKERYHEDPELDLGEGLPQASRTFVFTETSDRPRPLGKPRNFNTRKLLIELNSEPNRSKPSNAAPVTVSITCLLCLCKSKHLYDDVGGHQRVLHWPGQVMCAVFASRVVAVRYQLHTILYFCGRPAIISP